MIHELPLERRTLHGHFSRDLEPVLTVDPGDGVRFATLNAGWRDEHGDEFAARDPELDEGHALIGPIEVRGAYAGATLAVRVDAVRPGGWGVTFGNETMFRWSLDSVAGVGRSDTGREVALAPFLGVLGMPPPDSGIHSTGPPRVWGGNIDCKELVAGTTLFLPIPVDGALFSAGDGHARQGDGEVSGTAIECPCEEVRLTLDLDEELRIGSPIARIDGAWLAFGLDSDLNTAVDEAVKTMLELMAREHDIAGDEALALASVVVDLRVTQSVNGVRGVHALLRDDAIR
jgi:acetamidase/formamidase